jgi:hypothetical protein
MLEAIIEPEVHNVPNLEVVEQNIPPAFVLNLNCPNLVNLREGDRLLIYGQVLCRFLKNTSHKIINF